MTDRVNGSDDGRSVYHTCGPTPLPAVIDRDFVQGRNHGFKVGGPSAVGEKALVKDDILH